MCKLTEIFLGGVDHTGSNESQAGRQFGWKSSMRWAVGVMLLLMASTAWGSQCVSWRTVTETNIWGHTTTHVHCRAWAWSHTHYHSHAWDCRGRHCDLGMGAVVGPRHIIIIDRYHGRDHRRHRHCRQDRDGLWRCR